MKVRIFLIATLLIAGQASAQNFSCNYGKRASCLDYGDTVCSSSGKCVDSNAACFNSYQCNYEGFTCKSNVTSAVQAHDAVLTKFNSLVSDYNSLLAKNKTVVSAHNELLNKNNELVSDYNQLLAKSKSVALRLDEIKNCVSYASTVEAAQNCTY